MSTNSNNLKNYIEKLTEETIKEQNIPKHELANLYVKAIKRKDPDLYNMLLKQAIFAIKSVKKDKKPRFVVDDMHRLLKVDSDADPRKSGDTHGVRLFIDHLIDDPSLASKIKRFYQQSIDSLIKNTYSK